MFDATTLVGALVWGAIFIAAALVTSWLLGRTIGRLDGLESDRSPESRSRVRFALQMMRLVVFVVFFALWAHLIPSLRAFGTAFLASASVISIVLGIAAQNTLGNLIAGVSILTYRPFGIGDRIQVTAPTGLETGTVELINLSHTVITTFDNRRITVPNSQMMGQTLVNLTTVDPKVMAQVDVSISYDTDVTAARQVLQRLAEAHPDIDSIAAIPVTNLGPSAVTITAWVWCRDAATAKAAVFDLYEQVLTAFGEASISIPYPWTNVAVHEAPPQGPQA